MVDQELEQAIRQTAYLKWERAGCPTGDGVDFWLASEQEIRQQCQASFDGCAKVVNSTVVKAAPELVGVDETVDRYESRLEQGTNSSTPETVEFQQEARSARRSRRRASNGT